MAFNFEDFLYRPTPNSQSSRTFGKCVNLNNNKDGKEIHYQSTKGCSEEKVMITGAKLDNLEPHVRRFVEILIEEKIKEIEESL